MRARIEQLMNFPAPDPDPWVQIHDVAPGMSLERGLDVVYDVICQEKQLVHTKICRIYFFGCTVPQSSSLTMLIRELSPSGALIFSPFLVRFHSPDAFNLSATGVVALPSVLGMRMCRL